MPVHPDFIPVHASPYEETNGLIRIGRPRGLFMEEKVIVAKELVKEFYTKGSRAGVDGISLEIHRGEVYGVIGPDGAGKTTLTRLIIGLLSRTRGESSVLGFDSMHYPYEIRERVGYVAQQFTLPPELTVMENMLFFADIHGVPYEAQKQRVDELLEFTGLANFTDRITSRLSGGMKKSWRFRAA